MAKRSLDELIDAHDPAWPLLEQQIASASNAVEVLAVNRERAKEVLLHLQVTTRSYLGAVAFEAGGIFIDHGWLRLLGSGHERMCGDLLSWNSGDLHLSGACVVAHDVLGGFFALNGGAFPGQMGAVRYFAPDSLKWENLNLPYSQFLGWALSGDLARFYQGLRWPGWQEEIASLDGEQGLSVYPLLFTQRDLPVAQRSRRPIPLDELWRLYVYDPRNDT